MIHSAAIASHHNGDVLGTKSGETPEFSETVTFAGGYAAGAGTPESHKPREQTWFSIVGDRFSRQDIATSAFQGRIALAGKFPGRLSELESPFPATVLVCTVGDRVY